MVFVIDLPRLAGAAEHRATLFSTELFRFLKACQVDEKLVTSLANYDFSRTERLAFVHTMSVQPKEGSLHPSLPLFLSPPPSSPSSFILFIHI